MSGLLLFVGIRSDWLASPDGPSSVRAAFQQLGGLGLIVSAALLLLLVLRAEQRQAALALVRTFVTAATISLLAVFATGELTIRWIYRDGMSFTSHYGPLVRRFERNFRFNHFDGPSCGPAVVGPKAPGELRVLFQGDSITWGTRREGRDAALHKSTAGAAEGSESSFHGGYSRKARARDR
jgi:hypothetical protein